MIYSPPVRCALLLGSVALIVSGCGDQAESPVGPEAAPALSVSSAAALSFRQVSVGGQHACGVATDDRAYCWGFNFSGELGNGTSLEGPERCGIWPCSTRPIAVLGGLHFRHVSVGLSYSCGITTEQRAYCWGYNGSGQLGDGTTTDRLTPVAVAAGRRFRQVRAGSNHACAITPLDVAFCWGNDSQGQLGDGAPTAYRPSPVRVAGGLHWRQLSAGAGYTCGVTNGDRAYCWGNNGNGQLGDGTTILHFTPLAVVGGLLFRQIDAGYAHTCAVTTADRAYCWGYDGQGTVGDGTTGIARRRPTAVATTRRFDHVSAGDNHSCGVTLAGRGLCWGYNGDGELGDGTTTQRLTPVAISGDLALTLVTTGGHSSCAVTTDERAFCWGDNTYGQLGDGTSSDRLTPTPVVGSAQ
jgi:alpha-tubulin suppressor-like RCC1 family protein